MKALPCLHVPCNSMTPIAFPSFTLSEVGYTRGRDACQEVPRVQMFWYPVPPGYRSAVCGARRLGVMGTEIPMVLSCPELTTSEASLQF